MNEENKEQIARIVKNNLIEALSSLMNLGSYDTPTFGCVQGAFSGLETPELNYAFDIASKKGTKQDIYLAIDYIKKNKIPVSFITDRQNLSKTNKLFDLAGFSQSPPISLMVCDLKKPIKYKYDLTYEVEQITEQERLKDWSTVADQAFALPQNTTYRFFSKMPELFDKESSFSLYLHHMNNDPVAIVLSYFHKEQKIVGMYWGGVVPDKQHQGIETHVLGKLLTEAKQRQYKFVVAQCVTSSRHFALDLGFDECGAVDVYTNKKQSKKD